MKLKSIYIDESGISNINSHSTFAFVTIEVVNTTNINESILSIEYNLRLKHAHWRDMSWRLREKFAKEISKLEFEAHVVIHKNPINIQDALLLSIRHAIIDNNYKSMIIDGSKNEKIIKIIRQFLRSKNKSISIIRQKSDETAPVLRIADFIAGATRSFYDDNSNTHSHNVFDIIKSKIIFTTLKY